MSYGIIYKAIGPTGKAYIGQTVKVLERRKSNHKFLSLKGDKRTPFLVALLAEGFHNFKWKQIDTADSQEELDSKEKRWIEFYDSTNPEKGYNGTSGGIKYSLSAETLKKFSEVQKGEKNPKAKLTETDVRQIKTALVNNESCASIARKYGINRTAVSKIKLGENWAWLQWHDQKGI